MMDRTDRIPALLVRPLLQPVRNWRPLELFTVLGGNVSGFYSDPQNKNLLFTVAP